MKTYKISFCISALVFAIMLGLSLLLSFCIKTSTALYWSNVALGVVASALLVSATSVISYVCEEEKVIHTYYWKLIDLKHKMLVISTIPSDGSQIKEYYQAISAVNALFSSYFAICDQDFVLSKRKKPQKIYELQHLLHEYSQLSLAAEVKFREYICSKKDDCGQRTYSNEDFRKDIQTYIHFVDSYKDTDEPFVCYLDKKIREFIPILSKTKSEENHDGQA